MRGRCLLYPAILLSVCEAFQKSSHPSLSTALQISIKLLQLHRFSSHENKMVHFCATRTSDNRFPSATLARSGAVHAQVDSNRSSRMLSLRSAINTHKKILLHRFSGINKAVHCCATQRTDDEIRRLSAFYIVAKNR